MLFYCTKSRPNKIYALSTLNCTIFEKISAKMRLNLLLQNDMKKLYIVRHAKASNKFDGIDFERPLAKRGKESAPIMAQKIKSRGIQIPNVICSSATRTRQTLQLMKEVLGLPVKNIQFHKDLYLAPAELILHHIKDTPNEVNELMVVAHNPGVSDLISNLTTETISEVPTNSVACILFDTNSWKKINYSNGKLGYYIYPKMFNL